MFFTGSVVANVMLHNTLSNPATSLQLYAVVRMWFSLLQTFQTGMFSSVVDLNEVNAQGCMLVYKSSATASSHKLPWDKSKLCTQNMIPSHKQYNGQSTEELSRMTALLQLCQHKHTHVSKHMQTFVSLSPWQGDNWDIPVLIPSWHELERSQTSLGE